MNQETLTATHQPRDILTGLIARIVAGGAKKGIDTAFTTQPGQEASVFQKGITQGLQTAMSDTLADPDAVAKIETKGVDLVADQVVDTKKEILDHSSELLQQTAEKVAGTQKLNTYSIIRNSLDKPSQSPFRSIFNKFIARVLTFGVYAGSLFSAKFLDKITGRNESNINAGNIEQIFNGALKHITERPETPTQAPNLTPA